MNANISQCRKSAVPVMPKYSADLGKPKCEQFSLKNKITVRLGRIRLGQIRPGSAPPHVVQEKLCICQNTLRVLKNILFGLPRAADVSALRGMMTFRKKGNYL